MYPNLTRLWGPPQALEKARRGALRIAREEQRRRLAAASDGVPAQVMLGAHLGLDHLEFFRTQVAPLLPLLPEGFTALEIGAGMGWHAALLAASGAGRMIATEPAWEHETPYKPGNVHTLYHLAEREPLLAKSLSFDRDPQGNLTAVGFPPNLDFISASADHLPIADSRVDFLYSHNSLEHIANLEGAFAEAARALRLGGILFASSEPLFFSIGGHHLGDIFPIPWGHLLWPPQELAELVIREAGAGREWAPGIPLQAAHILSILQNDLNCAAPADLRRVLRTGPWVLEGWIDLALASDESVAGGIGVREALPGVAPEALFLRGVRMRLRRAERPGGSRWPLLLTHRTRRRLAAWRDRLLRD